MEAESIERVDESFQAWIVAYFELGQAQITEKLRKMIFTGLFEPFFMTQKSGKKHGKWGLKNPLSSASQAVFRGVCMRSKLKLRGEFFRNFSVIRVTKPGKIRFYRFLSNLPFLS